MSDKSDKNVKKRWIVVTTINPPTPTIKFISDLCNNGWSAVVIGDISSPPSWEADNIIYLSIDRQREIFGEYADLIPYRHYCRKNLGYLYALSQGADFILETDDDNIPYESFGQKMSRMVSGRLVKGRTWVNIYKYYTDVTIWPRGLPLDEIHSFGTIADEIKEFDCPVQQFLADQDPDVDAIYRLIFKSPVIFRKLDTPLILAENTWSPFNSQNTLFFADAFPLLYLPCHVSFRMTDIWRSFVVQATLWTHGYNIAFQNATVKQIRNTHDLMRDFKDEVPGYEQNRYICHLLQETRANLTDNDTATLANTAQALWKGMITEGIIPKKESPIIKGWFDLIDDLYPAK